MRPFARNHKVATKVGVSYSEAVGVLYFSSVFNLNDPGDIRYFSRAILPQHMHLIHSIILEWEGVFSNFDPFNDVPKQDDRELQA